MSHTSDKKTGHNHKWSGKIPTLEGFIRHLTQGTKLHVNLHFMFSQTPEMSFFDVNLDYRSHTRPACNYAKIQEKKLTDCMANKKRSIKKALELESPYVGKCYRGIHEIVYPIYHKGNPMCILYLGNILLESQLHQISFDADNQIIHTMAIAEEDDLTDFMEIAGLIADVIHSHFLILDQSNQLKTPDKLHWAIRQALDHIDLNYSCDISLREIADLCFLNEQYMSRLFKKQLGRTFSDQLNQRRLFISKQLLSDTGKSVTDIAQLVGYNNVTYFNKCFKQAFGISPRKFRQSNSNEPT